MKHKLIIRINLRYYLAFCLERNIQPTFENSVLFLKAIVLGHQINSTIPYKYYDKFKIKMKRKLETNNNRYFQITLHFK
jgi:hypothetical protein